MMPDGTMLREHPPEDALSSSAHASMTPRSRRRRRAGWVLLVLGILAVLVGTTVPASAIGWLRNEIPYFAAVADWLAAPVPGLNPLHILVFAVIACWWRMLTPRGSRWPIVLVLAALAVLTEFLQRFVPGRDPRVSDVLNDLVGVALGFALAALISRWRRRNG